MLDYLVMCPVCNRPMRMGESKTTKHLLKYYCPVCRTGIDSDNFGIPLGFPESPEIRSKRVKAHNLFENFYKSEGFSKRKAYIWLSSALNVKLKEAHISQLSEAKLDNLICMLS